MSQVKTPQYSQSVTATEVDWEQFQLLPFLLDLLDSVRENEASGAAVAKNVSLLVDRLAVCKKTLDTLPGTEYTREQKEQLYQDMKQKLNDKCDLLAKYKTFAIFNASNVNPT